MGIYHLVVNETKKEFIEPGDVNDGSIKQGFVLGPTANLTCWLMLSADHWRGDHVVIVNDTTDHYQFVDDTYKNVTRESIEAYNAYWDARYVAPLRHTPYPRSAS